MIPPGLDRKHFLQAAAQIDRQGVPVHRRSVHYDLVLDGKRYPPKYVISLATKYAMGIEHPPSDFNAVEAKNYFLAREYKVTDRRGNAPSTIVPEDDESTFPEGGKRFHWHRTSERNPTIAKKAKERRLAKSGELQCDVCSFDFTDTYGQLGEGFIEAHHTVPVAMLQGPAKTKLSEIALVCSNCHRMLHRGKRLLSVQELKEIVESL